MFPNKKVILLNGKARSGKDTVAAMMKRILKNSNQKVEVVSFAEPLKEIISKTFDLDLSLLEKYKNNPDVHALKCINTNTFESEYTSDFREILQRFGTEGMKPVFGNDVWARLAAEKCKKSDSEWIIISDFRFLIEYSTMMKYQSNEDFQVFAFKVESDNPNILVSSHSSETELNSFEFDYSIQNNWGHLRETEEQIEHILFDVFKVQK